MKSYWAIKLTSLANLFSPYSIEDWLEVLLSSMFFTENPVLNLFKKYLNQIEPSTAVPDVCPILRDGSPMSTTSTLEKSCEVWLNINPPPKVKCAH